MVAGGSAAEGAGERRWRCLRCGELRTGRLAYDAFRQFGDAEDADDDEDDRRENRAVEQFGGLGVVMGRASRTGQHSGTECEEEE